MSASQLLVSDDHGVSLHRAADRARGNAGRRADHAGTQPALLGTNWGGAASVDISALQNLAPGDAVRVRAEAVDASPWAQRGVSREIVLRRATSEEQRTPKRAHSAILP